MNVVKGEETLQKYNLKTGNKFASIRAIAEDIRKHQADNNYIPTISESMTFILEGEEPKSISDYVAFHKRVDTVIEEDLEGVLSETVKEYVAKSIHNSIKHHKLIFEYPYNDDGYNTKIRIHCRQIWNKLGFSR